MSPFGLCLALSIVWPVIYTDTTNAALLLPCPLGWWVRGRSRRLCMQSRIYSQQGPVQKNVGPSPGAADPIFLLEKVATFFSHHRPCVRCQFSSKTGHLFCSSLSFTRESPIISGMQKFAAPFVGALFCGGPLFGRTCWTCLNPPLSAWLVRIPEERCIVSCYANSADITQLCYSSIKLNSSLIFMWKKLIWTGGPQRDSSGQAAW